MLAALCLFRKILNKTEKMKIDMKMGKRVNACIWNIQVVLVWHAY